MVTVKGMASHPDGAVELRSDADIVSGPDARVGGEERFAVLRRMNTEVASRSSPQRVSKP